MRPVRLLLPVLLAALPSLAAALPFELSERQQFYAVDAISVDGLREQIDANRPQSLAGRPSHGLLKVDLSLRYELQPAGALCRLHAPRVSVDLELWLPLWRPREEPEPALRAAWEATFAGLLEHEAGHREKVLASAAELAERVAAMDLGPADCGALRRELLGMRLAAVSRLALRNAAYDRRTGHGERQGAVLALERQGLDRCTRRESLLRRDCARDSR